MNAVTAAFADDDEFKVVEGSFVDVVRQRGKTATVEFDYLDATIADRENSGRTLKQWLQDEDPKVLAKWDKHMEDAEEYFRERWNDESKKNIKIVKDGNPSRLPSSVRVTLELPIGVSASATVVSSSAATCALLRPALATPSARST